MSKSCPACGSRGANGEYGRRCPNRDCRVVFYGEETNNYRTYSL